ncbi:hypothetical protein OK016_19160 [Vibrio chagasii]|nr:hypothetical protein [Vibrio chagasii]
MKSSPEAIFSAFRTSKGTFKRPSVVCKQSWQDLIDKEGISLAK